MNDPLDRILKDDAARALADEDFTARVMATLPAPRAHGRPWLRPLLILGSAALGSILAVALSPTTMLQGYLDLLRHGAFTTAAVSSLAIGLALLASATILAIDTE